MKAASLNEIMADAMRKSHPKAVLDFRKYRRQVMRVHRAMQRAARDENDGLFVMGKFTRKVARYSSAKAYARMLRRLLADQKRFSNHA